MDKYPTKYGKPVEKIDMIGKVVATYPSITVAAKANHMSESAVKNRCKNLILDPFARTGFSFRYGALPTDRLVEKIDQDGRVLAVYPNMVEAAKANYVSTEFVQDRCHNRTKGDPFRSAGFSFRFLGKAGKRNAN